MPKGTGLSLSILGVMDQIKDTVDFSTVMKDFFDPATITECRRHTRNDTVAKHKVSQMSQTLMLLWTSLTSKAFGDIANTLAEEALGTALVRPRAFQLASFVFPGEDDFMSYDKTKRRLERGQVMVFTDQWTVSIHVGCCLTTQNCDLT